MSQQMLNAYSEPVPNVAQSSPSCTIYVEGLPQDATEREVAHIFRPYEGFTGLRLVPRITRENHKVHFAFADFQSERQAEIVINTL